MGFTVKVKPGVPKESINPGSKYNGGYHLWDSGFKKHLCRLPATICRQSPSAIRFYAISGGGDLTSDVVEIYDVETDTWNQGPPIPTKRGWFGAVLLNQQIYTIAGKTIRSDEEKARTGDPANYDIPGFRRSTRPDDPNVGISQANRCATRRASRYTL